MELCYNGNLVMPANFAAVSEDEMQYIEGGGTVKVVITAATQKNLIQLGLVSGTTWLGKAIGSAIGGVAGGILGASLGGAIGNFMNTLLVTRLVKGDITLLSTSNVLIPNQTVSI